MRAKLSLAGLLFYLCSTPLWAAINTAALCSNSPPTLASYNVLLNSIPPVTTTKAGADPIDQLLYGAALRLTTATDAAGNLYFDIYPNQRNTYQHFIKAAGEVGPALSPNPHLLGYDIRTDAMRATTGCCRYLSANREATIPFKYCLYQALQRYHSLLQRRSSSEATLLDRRMHAHAQVLTLFRPSIYPSSSSTSGTTTQATTPQSTADHTAQPSAAANNATTQNPFSFF